MITAHWLKPEHPQVSCRTAEAVCAQCAEAARRCRVLMRSRSSNAAVLRTNAWCRATGPEGSASSLVGARLIEFLNNLA